MEGRERGTKRRGEKVGLKGERDRLRISLGTQSEEGMDIVGEEWGEKY